jgi:hypothetical protein
MRREEIMKRFGSIRYAAAVAVLGALVAAVVAVATAQAAPSKKNYTMQVAVRDNTVSHQTFTVTLTNDLSSNTTLGSANVSPPAGFHFDTDPAKAGPDQAGWTATVVSNVLQIRSLSSSDSLAPGHSMTAFVRIDTPASLPTTNCDAAWSVLVKQSNDFNGTNNWFTRLTAGSDLTPLGSFTIGTLVNAVFVPQIGTQIGDVFAPAIKTGITTDATVNALDTCGATKTNYSGPTTLAHNLNQATVSGPTWSGGIGTVPIKPTISETDRNVTVSDNLTGISKTSDPFDTQQRICTSADILTGCGWRNGNGSINASAPAPGSGSLGVGFNPIVPFSCNSGTAPLGGTVITIAPHGTSNPGDLVPFRVTLVYSKQVSGTGSANSFVFCETTHADGTGWVLLPLCSSLAAGDVRDCVVDQKRVTGGALQVILSLVGDPYVGGK